MTREHDRRSEEVPVDLEVARLPEVARLRRRLLAKERAVMARQPDRAAFIRYTDARTDLAAAREESYFDAGHLRGRLAGRLDGGRCSAEGRALGRQVMEMVISSALPAPVAAAALMESARALVLERGTSGVHGHERRRRRNSSGGSS